MDQTISDHILQLMAGAYETRLLIITANWTSLSGAHGLHLQAPLQLFWIVHFTMLMRFRGRAMAIACLTEWFHGI